jgi:hypothetical protein
MSAPVRDGLRLHHKERPMQRLKDPNKVKGGKARQHQLREQLGEEGYRDYQKAHYAKTLAAHPNFHAQGAQAANSAQLASWGEEGYAAQRKAAYQACRSKYGLAFVQRVVRAAHEARRLHRLDHPTPGEAALRALLGELHFQVILSQTRFDYCSWRCDPFDWQLGPDDALAEGGVGPYCCDVLVPVRRVAIEVEGGIHLLRRERDARRCAFLIDQGLNVVVLTEQEALDTNSARTILHSQLLCSS